MNSLSDRFSAKPFSHIYYEEDALNYSTTKDILDCYADSHHIPIKHYKDIFNRPNQDYMAQKEAPALILAVNHGESIYPGAKVCQSFGNDNFYYCSVVKNCIFDCEYCYLQGLYPTANIVIFVNIEDVFHKVENMLLEHSMYICISYDTDLLALEGLCHYVTRWIDFASEHENLKLEVRTKSASTLYFEEFKRNKNIIFAWTMSPDEIITSFENHTPSLDARIKALNKAISLGYTVRIAFDPMIYVPDYQNIYARMYEKVFSCVNPEAVLDVSIGLFRISADYIKNMKKKRACLTTMYPYENIDNVCSYDKKRSDEMLSFAESELSKYISLNKVYST